MYMYEDDIDVQVKDKEGNLCVPLFPSKDTLVKITNEDGSSSKKTLKEFLEETTEHIELIENKKTPTRVSELENDSGFITNGINNLLNYYNTDNSYNKEEINNMIENISTINIRIVDILPSENISNSTIYFILKEGGTQNNIYDEYIYIGTQWEKIGNTNIDLSNYLQITSLASTIGNSSITTMTQKAITEALNEKTSKEIGKGLSTNDFSNSYKEKVDNCLSVNDTAIKAISDGNGLNIADSYSLKTHDHNTIYSKKYSLLSKLGLEGSGWYRVVGMKVADIAILNGAAGQSFIININRGYTTIAPEQYTIICRNVYNDIDFELYSKKIGNIQTITGIRYIRETDGIYIDIYSNQNVINANDISISLYQNDGAWGTYVNVISPTITSTTTTPQAELDLVNAKDVFSRLDDLESKNRRIGTEIVSVSGNYADVEFTTLLGSLFASASVGNMTEETNNIYVTGCTVLNHNKIRVFFNTTINTALRINYYITKVV